MILFWLIAILLLAGLAAWVAGQWSPLWPRRIALAALGLDLVLVLGLWAGSGAAAVGVGPAGPWLVELSWSWIPRFGIRFLLAADGLSLLLLVLTCFLGLMAVAASWTEIRERCGFYYFNLLWALAGVLGVFTALDLFLFFVFWEVMLVPMYFLIALWGHGRRVYAATKFFLFTQASGLLMLVAILGLALAHHAGGGALTFAYADLLGASLGSGAAFWLMLGFFLAFAVKLPAVPLHTWLPDAHGDAPTGGSVILAGILLKTGAYGLIRFVVPLFPEAAMAFAPLAMLLGVVGILYGALLAFAQDDLKRLVAYTSVSHMGFVLLGVFAWNAAALQGAVMQVIAHGISTGALFMVAGALQQRLGTRDMRRMGGLWSEAPRLAAIGLFFAVASLGLPGLGNFVAEFLVLLGAFQVNLAAAVVAALGLVGAAVYALVLVQRVFHGTGAEQGGRRPVADFGARELVALGAMMAVIIWLGIYPQPVLDTAAPALQGLERAVPAVPVAAGAGAP